ncbi:MAG: thiamine phosphate synthase [Rhodospirillaceae bacterium]|nr:thiamine phosphate synthase [Rhodospirillaceae bacterium]
MNLPSVWWMTDETRVRDPLRALARLPRGTAVILRHYGQGDRNRLAAKMARTCRRLRLPLVIAGTWRLAAAVCADGLHLPEHAALEAGARLWLKRGKILSRAAHGPRALARAAPADAVLLSPINPTASHPGREALGVTRAALMARAAAGPVIALGGVSPKHLGMLKRRGFAGIAGIGFALAD